MDSNPAKGGQASTVSMDIGTLYKQMVGAGELESPTPSLSVTCSNQLSYAPIHLFMPVARICFMCPQIALNDNDILAEKSG